jgi:hypothetical protein
VLERGCSELLGREKEKHIRHKTTNKLNRFQITVSSMYFNQIDEMKNEKASKDSKQNKCAGTSDGSVCSLYRSQ